MAMHPGFPPKWHQLLTLDDGFPFPVSGRDASSKAGILMYAPEYGSLGSCDVLLRGETFKGTTHREVSRCTPVEAPTQITTGRQDVARMRTYSGGCSM